MKRTILAIAGVTGVVLAGTQAADATDLVAVADAYTQSSSPTSNFGHSGIVDGGGFATAVDCADATNVRITHSHVAAYSTTGSATGIFCVETSAPLSLLVEDSTVENGILYEARGSSAPWPAITLHGGSVEGGIALNIDTGLHSARAIQVLGTHLNGSIFQSGTNRLADLTLDGVFVRGINVMALSTATIARSRSDNTITLRGATTSARVTIENSWLPRLSLTNITANVSLGEIESGVQISGQSGARCTRVRTLFGFLPADCGATPPPQD